MREKLLKATDCRRTFEPEEPKGPLIHNHPQITPREILSDEPQPEKESAKTDEDEEIIDTSSKNKTSVDETDDSEDIEYNKIVRLCRFNLFVNILEQMSPEPIQWTTEA